MDHAYEPVFDEGEIEPFERRGQFRNRNAFKICSIGYSRETYLSILRNLSDEGAQIELFPDLDIREGERITYQWDEVEALAARVIWRTENRIGVQNIGLAKPDLSEFPARPIRAECEIPCLVRRGMDEVAATIANISLTGVLVCGLDPKADGSLATITMRGMSFYNASQRWTGNGIVGFRFDRPLRISELGQLFSGLG